MYYQIALRNVNVRLPLNEKKLCQLCEASTDSIVTVKLYTRKELVMVEMSIFEFHQHLYIPTIQKLTIHLPQLNTLVTHHCGNTHRDSFKYN